MLESTTYPGTTREELLPILEQSGLEVGKDFLLAFSPERVDPGRTDWTTKNTPKIVGGLTPACTERACALYGRALDTVVPVSSPEAAELTKLLENIFRSVNIALVNELAQLCDRMGVDVWEVVEAAATKPFGFMSFKPGPGPRRPLPPRRSLLPLLEGARVRLLHGVHRARRQDQREHALLLPREDRPRAQRAASAALKGSRVHLVGVAYKADVGDLRESPALKLIELLRAGGAEVSYHDPHVPELPEHGLVSADAGRRGRRRRLRRHRDRALGHRLRRRSPSARASSSTSATRRGRTAAPNGHVWKL